MEQSITRRRDISTITHENKSKLSICEEFLVLLGARKLYYGVNDPTSLCLRAAILSEMILNANVNLDTKNNLFVKAGGSKNVHIQKCIIHIRSSQHTISKWLGMLNGESFNPKHRFQLKKMRSTIYKQLEEKKIVILSNSLAYSKVTISNVSLKEIIYNQVIDYLYRGTSRNYRNDVLVCLLFYSKVFNSFFIPLDLQKQTTCMAKVISIVNSYKNYFKKEDQLEDMISQLLKALLNK